MKTTTDSAFSTGQILFHNDPDQWTMEIVRRMNGDPSVIETIAENLPFSLHIINLADATVLLKYNGLYSNFGYTEEEVNNFISDWNVFITHIHPEDLPNIVNGLQKTAESNGNYFRFKKKSGDWAWLMVSSYRQRSGEPGEPIILTTISIEITALVESSGRLRAALEQLRRVKNQAHKIKDLTKREIQIIGLLAKENSPIEIADALAISEHTVRVHTKNIHKKLGVNSIAGVFTFAVDFGLI